MSSSPSITEIKITPNRDMRLSPMSSPSLNRAMKLGSPSSPIGVRRMTPLGTPILGRRSPMCDSESEFAVEKSALIGELTSRMKRNNVGFNKNRRDDGTSDDENEERLYGENGPRNISKYRPPVSVTTSSTLRAKPGGGGAAPSRARSKSPCVTNRPNAPRSRFLTPGHTPRASPRASPMRSVTPSKALRPANPKDPKQSLDPEIQAKIGNRAVKTVPKSIGTCGICNKVVTLEGCTAFGKVFHKDCFKCVICKKKIDGKFFHKDGKPYCAKDYQKVSEACCICNQPIKGDSVVVNKKVYHPGCMTCFVCGEPLKGSYFTYEDKPICEKDYKDVAAKCCECGENITGKCYTIDGKSYCEADYKGSCDSCPRCGKDVEAEFVRIKGAVFHPKCFTCVVCGKSMEHESFSKDDKLNIYCPEDYTKKFANKCSFCKRPIVPEKGETSAPRIRALNKDYHPKCFQCEDCGLVLDSKIRGRECYPFKGHILCIKCNRKKLSSDEESSSGDDEEEEEQENQ